MMSNNMHKNFLVGYNTRKRALINMLFYTTGNNFFLNYLADFLCSVVVSDTSNKVGLIQQAK